MSPILYEMIFLTALTILTQKNKILKEKIKVDKNSEIVIFRTLS